MSIIHLTFFLQPPPKLHTLKVMLGSGRELSPHSFRSDMGIICGLSFGRLS